MVDGRLERVSIVIPDGVRMPEGGLNIRLLDNPLQQEARLQEFKRDAMLAFVRANRLNRWITSGGRAPKMGIATLGKSYLDVRLALDELGIDEVRANDLGIRLFKIACPWPLSKLELMEFADDLDMIMVVEEKRSLVEVQVREELYGTAHQPTVVGKKDERGEWLFPVKGALEPTDIAVAIGRRLLAYASDEQLAARVAQLEERAAGDGAGRGHRGAHAVLLLRLPAQHLDQGAGRHARLCRHRLPLHGAVDGPRHDRLHRRWAGRAPTGSARRRSPSAATCSRTWAMAPTTTPARWRSGPPIAAGVNVTYKILYNDAVAMTGGQRLDGGLTAVQDRAAGCRRRRRSASGGVERAVEIRPGRCVAGGRAPSTRARTSTRCSANCATSPASPC